MATDRLVRHVQVAQSEVVALYEVQVLKHLLQDHMTLRGGLEQNKETTHEHMYLEVCVVFIT